MAVPTIVPLAGGAAFVAVPMTVPLAGGTAFVAGGSLRGKPAPTGRTLIPVDITIAALATPLTRPTTATTATSATACTMATA
ncbi:hypothetical protein [Streptomyces sp. Caat 7-52]|uniref:hypothetical protein n=1 Tax=Streptomyces sp. Caat 7-52 TaxID=2949637 RepID=UPI0020357C76|nr:hypothetical protein [Streptomyces sp. Caat 7-52]